MPRQPMLVTRRERAKSGTREKILRAATRVLLREGVDGFSMRKLAGQIGFTPTAIYFHFPDKQALLGEVVDRQFMVFRQAFQRISRTPDPLRRLALMGAAFVEFALSHPAHYRFMFLCRLDQIPRGRWIEKGNPSQDCYALLVETVSAAIEQRCLRAELQDPHLVAQVFFAGVHGLMALHLIKGQDDWVQWAPIRKKSRLMIAALIAGLGRTPAAAGSRVSGRTRGKHPNQDKPQGGPELPPRPRDLKRRKTSRGQA